MAAYFHRTRGFIGRLIIGADETMIQDSLTMTILHRRRGVAALDETTSAAGGTTSWCLSTCFHIRRALWPVSPKSDTRSLNFIREPGSLHTVVSGLPIRKECPADVIGTILRMASELLRDWLWRQFLKLGSS
jgi:hypothetical protein